jgi:ABC-type uncharacterized transport system substrate-binding protein
MIDRRTFVGTIAGSLLASPLAADAQQPNRIPRVGVLWAGTPDFAKPYVTAGLDAMRELGWIEGRTFAVEYRFAERDVDRLPTLASDLVQLKVDVIVAAGDPAVRAAMTATRTIPIVMVAVGDAVSLGFVSSLSRPGGTVTGLEALSVELSGKRLELLKQIVPRASRIAVLWNPDNPAGILGYRETERVAQQLRVTPLSVPIKSRDEIEPAFATMVQQRAEAPIVVTDPLTWVRRRPIIGFAAQHRLPAIYELREYVDDSGLISYGPSLTEMIRRVAIFVDKILKGTKAGDLPVEQPTTFELFINLKTAKALGLTLPGSLLSRANQLIQ